MNGFIRKALLVSLALAGSVGCFEYRDCVDPCYPMRYSSMARKEVNMAFAPQVQNGQVLDQTVWNYFFEPGSDRLTPLGLDRLSYIARRRPSPDCNVFLQTAQDILYDAAAPEHMAETRHDLDMKRIASVQRYLISYTAGHPVAFNVVITDPGDPSLSGVWVNGEVLQMYGRTRGGLLSGGGGAGASGGASGGAGVQGSASGIGAGTGR
jgi:hypothetical protein